MAKLLDATGYHPNLLSTDIYLIPLKNAFQVLFPLVGTKSSRFGDNSIDVLGASHSIP